MIIIIITTLFHHTNDDNDDNSDCDRISNYDNNINNNNNNDEENEFVLGNRELNIYRKRKQLQIHRNQYRKRWNVSPPNLILEEPIDFVRTLVETLRRNRGEKEKDEDDSLTSRYCSCYYDGARCLLESSTASWRRILLHSIGYKNDVIFTNDDHGDGDASSLSLWKVARVLQNALERKNNQYEILVRRQRSLDNENENYWIEFPSEPVEYLHEDDGKDCCDDENDHDTVVERCWVESRFRSSKDDQLLAIIGWSLVRRKRETITTTRQLKNNNTQELQRPTSATASLPSPSLLSRYEGTTNNTDDCWLLDGIDWQDFRDEFRPGLGREEWERICG